MFTAIAIMRPVLACAVTDSHLSTHRTAAMRAVTIKETLPESAKSAQAFLQLEQEFGESSSTPDESGEDGPSEGGLDDIASLAYELEMNLELETSYSLMDESAQSIALDPLLRPPAAA